MGRDLRWANVPFRVDVPSFHSQVSGWSASTHSTADTTLNLVGTIAGIKNKLDAVSEFVGAEGIGEPSLDGAWVRFTMGRDAQLGCPVR